MKYDYIKTQDVFTRQRKPKAKMHTWASSALWMQKGRTFLSGGFNWIVTRPVISYTVINKLSRATLKIKPWSLF